MRNIYLFLLALMMSFEMMAQSSRITGTILDGFDGQGMIGANVVEKGTTNGTITDLDGNFSLEITTKNPVLIISSIGYQSQEIPVGNQTTIRITLQEDTQLLDEVVVVGYGTMKKSDLSGAVSSIKREDLLKGNPADLSQGLQGKIAGVVVNQNDGTPGGGVSINIRGTNSFSTSSQPLYIVDGIPFDAGSTPSDNNSNSNQTSNPLTFINPHDIQSIEILKDASATAIYGSRGANGVVLITTKKGEVGKDKIEFSSNFTFSRIANRVKVLDAYTYANYVNEGTMNSYKYANRPYSMLNYPGEWTYQSTNGVPDYSTGKYNPGPSDFLNPGLYTDAYGNETSVGVADWQDMIYQNGFSQEYNISVSGGSEKGWHAFSGNYLNQEGTIKNSGFTRYSLRANIARKIYDWMEIGLNTSFTSTDTDFAKTSSSNYGIIRSALIFPPTYDPYVDTTTSDELNWLAANPYAYVNSAKDNLQSINVFNSSFLELRLFPYLKFRQNLGIGYSNNRRNTYYDRHTQEGMAPTNGSAGQSDNWYNSITAESLLTFDKTFNKIHAFNAVAGFTVEKANWGSKSMTATNFPNDLTGEYDMSQGLNAGSLQSDRGSSGLVSLLARVNYTLNSKYIFTASFRRDGSSKFTEENKYANFLSGAFAWRISEEQFIKDLNIFSNLKYRMSYGQTGNQAIGSYRTLAMLSTANYPFGGSLSSGVAEVNWRGPVAEDLRWETTSQYNLGLDIGVWEGRVNVTLDYYYKKTKDLLQEVKIPKSTGFSNMMVNRGYVTNEGLEISANVVILRDTPLKWNIDGNIGFNRNKIGGLDADQYANSLWYKADNVFIQRNGFPIGTIYGYVEDGFYDNEAEVRADPIYTHASDEVVRSMIGEIKYRDLDEDGEITEADRTIIGDTNPKFTYGITNNFRWKNFTFSFFLQGSQGNDIFNGNLMDVQMANIGNIPRFAYESRWTEENRANAKWPKAIAGYDREMKISDRYVEDGSYLKLKNITFGYTWKPQFKGIDNIHFYASANNLFTITNYSWFDPEVNAFGTDASRKGVDIYSYPASRTFSLGFKVDF